MAKQFKISLDRAQKIKDDFFKAFPQATLWLQQVAEFGIKNKFVMTPFGSVIPIQYNPNDENSVAAARRHCVNYPNQGAASYITNMTGVFALPLIQKRQLDCKVLLNVHDALYWEIPEHQISQLRECILEAIEQVRQYIGCRVKLEVEFKKGKNLADQSKVEAH